MGCSGKYDFVKKRGIRNWYRKFDAETLEPIGKPFLVDHGEEFTCGAQNITTDGKYHLLMLLYVRRGGAHAELHRVRQGLQGG